MTKTSSKIELGLVELIPKILAQYLSWGLSNWIFSVGLGSKWLTGSSSTGRSPDFVIIMLTQAAWLYVAWG